MINKLAQKYLDLSKGKKLFPPLNNYSPFIQGSEYNSKRHFGVWYSKPESLAQPHRVDLCVLIREGRSQVRLPEDDYKYFSSFGLKEFISNRESFEKKTTFFYDNIAKIDALCPPLTYKVLAKKSWPELFEMVDDIRDTIWDSNAAVSFSIYLDKEMCKGVVSEEALDAMWDRATEAAFKSFDKAQLMDILEKIVAQGEGSRSGKGWPEVVESCQYFFTDYFSAKNLKITEEMLRERYGKYIGDVDAAGQMIQHEKGHLAELESEHQAWLGTLPEKERALAEYLQLVMKVRDNRKNFFAKGLTVIYRIAERMFNECGVDLSLIPYYTVRELLKGSEYLKSMKDDLAKRRSGFTILIPFDGPVEMETAPVDEGIDAIDAFFREGHQKSAGGSDKGGQDSRVLKGQTGCKGIVKGKVRVVTSSASFKDFIAGEILVAGMTRPEYVPLMEKAAAIITDEGGITCHAAIVSRELEKPCIIGTKIATQVLKTGDVVEMDAAAGIVRILS